MSTLPEEDVPQPDELDAEDQERFEQGCMRVLAGYLILYVAGGVATTVWSLSTGSGWPAFVGWTWPLWATVIVFGLSSWKEG